MPKTPSSPEVIHSLKTRAASRRALTTVDNELRTHLTSAIALLSKSNLIDAIRLPDVWALEIETRDGVRVRFESGQSSPTSNPAATYTAQKPVPKRLEQTIAQQTRLAKELKASGISEGTYASILHTHGITNSLELDRPTMTSVITAIGVAGKQVTA